MSVWQSIASIKKNAHRMYLAAWQVFVFKSLLVLSFLFAVLGIRAQTDLIKKPHTDSSFYTPGTQERVIRLYIESERNNPLQQILHINFDEVHLIKSTTASQYESILLEQIDDSLITPNALEELLQAFDHYIQGDSVYILLHGSPLLVKPKNTLLKDSPFLTGILKKTMTRTFNQPYYDPYREEEE